MRSKYATRSSRVTLSGNVAKNSSQSSMVGGRDFLSSDIRQGERERERESDRERES
jgi:hypothetical protein